MSKKLTAKETMQALLDGKKVRFSSWPKEYYIKLNASGEVENQKGNSKGSFVLMPGYEIYEEPKPKKKVWQWRALHRPASDNWSVYPTLLTEAKAKDVFAGIFKYEKHAGPFEVEE